MISYISLSTLVLNSRDRPENIWLLKRMRLDKQPYKNQNMKTNLNAITTTLTTLYLHSNKPNAAKFVHWRILKISNKITFSSARQPACQQKLTQSLYTLGIQPSNFLKINVISVGTNLCYSNRNTRCAPSYVLVHSF